MTRLISGVLVVAALGASLTAEAQADPILINFDVDTNSMPVASGTEVDSLYVTLGVTFEATADFCSPDLHVYASDDCVTQGTSSKPNVVSPCDGCSDFSEDAQGPIRAIFTTPASDVCATFIPAHEEDYAVLRAYDAAHVLLQEVFSKAGVMGPLCLTDQGIHSVEFAAYSFYYGWFDDLSVTFEPVPAVPTTFGGIKAFYR
jgi:hypothetical protein